MDIRTLKSRAEVRELISVHGLAWRNAYAGLLPEHVLQAQTVDPTDEEVKQWFERLRDSPDGVLIAVDKDDTVRGFADFRWGSSVTKSFVTTNDAELKSIYVEPDYWGRGIGTSLLERGLETLPEQTERLRLEVLSDNDVGKRFYEARGFEKTDTSSYVLGDSAYPTCIYTLEI
ncbi:GNAT family N-acetyltransferase [Natrinema salaciae]|uniref:Acetyltransferase (GNAT) family protein n=1 Tax=Natrinema salaciae TaxID=1186196 RepID=A0A1H9LEJ2_9EURY|nr:GNAT family N-acetyltransferase [Natrinema salaciae]SER09555.1 Acetyltransferase (GNAT) family protein [Natrinema salaciae]